MYNFYKDIACSDRSIIAQKTKTVNKPTNYKLQQIERPGIPNKTLALSIHYSGSPVSAQQIQEDVKQYNDYVTFLNEVPGFITAFTENGLTISKTHALAIWPEEVVKKIFSLNRYYFETPLHVEQDILYDCNFIQGAIYTWTEEQVKEKLENVVQEYVYLDTLDEVIGKSCYSVEEAQKELNNLFRFFRISAGAMEKLNPPWYPAMKIMHKVSVDGIMHMTADEQKGEIVVLKQAGKDAMGALVDAKPVLGQILEARNIEYTTEELNNIFVGLKEVTYESTLSQFESLLNNQIAKIQQARNRAVLLTKWTTLTGEETVKGWCVTHKAPIRWILPKEYIKAIDTIVDVQQNNRVLDQHVIHYLLMTIFHVHNRRPDWVEDARTLIDSVPIQRTDDYYNALDKSNSMQKGNMMM